MVVAGFYRELWAFNEEKGSHIRLEYPLYPSATKLIYCFGLVADVSATPSAAGEIAVRELSGIYQTLDRLDEGLQYSISRYLMLQNAKIQNLSDSYIMKYPERFFSNVVQRLDYNTEKMVKFYNSITRPKWDKFAGLVSNLEALNPLSIMMRGFLFSLMLTTKLSVIRSTS